MGNCLIISHHFRNLTRFPFGNDLEDTNAVSCLEFLVLFKCVRGVSEE